ncbi:MAG: Ig-like domain-containing protein [Isosphaeraceae bacterium]
MTGGAGQLANIVQTGQGTLTLTFPAISGPESGQVRDGELVVTIGVWEAAITGLIRSSLQLATPSGTIPPGGEATFVATVGGNGQVAPGASSGAVVEFYVDGQSIGTAPVDATGTARITISTLAPGRHTVVAGYGGDANFTGAVSNVVTQLVGSLVGPHVVEVERFGYHLQPTSLVLSFDAALDPSRAVDLSAYRLLTAGRDGRFGTRDDGSVAFVSASYDAATHTVTLAPKQRLSLWQPYRLIVKGTGSASVTDIHGNPLDGQNVGGSGSDYQATVTRANWTDPRLRRPVVVRNAGRKLNGGAGWLLQARKGLVR